MNSSHVHASVDRKKLEGLLEKYPLRERLEQGVCSAHVGKESLVIVHAALHHIYTLLNPDPRVVFQPTTVGAQTTTPYYVGRKFLSTHPVWPVTYMYTSPAGTIRKHYAVKQFDEWMRGYHEFAQLVEAYCRNAPVVAPFFLQIFFDSAQTYLVTEMQEGDQDLSVHSRFTTDTERVETLCAVAHLLGKFHARYGTHGDVHLGNIIYRKGEFLMIDLETSHLYPAEECVSVERKGAFLREVKNDWWKLLSNARGVLINPHQEEEEVRHMLEVYNREIEKRGVSLTYENVKNVTNLYVKYFYFLSRRE